MKKEKLKVEIQNWRQLNMKRAREVRALQIREKKDKELTEKLDNLALTVDEKVEKEVESKVSKLLEDADVKSLKGDFYKVFYKVGGVKGMVDWIKKDIKNRAEYYKLFTSLLKSESQKQISTQKQAVIFQIITPENKQEYVINGECRTETDN